MALDTFIAGRYSGTYNSVDVGVTEEGYEVQQDAKAQLISPSDAYGDAIIDFIYRGGDCYLQFESKAYKAGSITPFWPFGAIGLMVATAGPIGRLASDIAAAMVLTSVSGTPAVASPATLTGTKAILAPNNPARLMFNSKLRTVPVRLLLLPYDATGGNIRWFAIT